MRGETLGGVQMRDTTRMRSITTLKPDYGDLPNPSGSKEKHFHGPVQLLNSHPKACVGEVGICTPPSVSPLI